METSLNTLKKQVVPGLTKYHENKPYNTHKKIVLIDGEHIKHTIARRVHVSEQDMLIDVDQFIINLLTKHNADTFIGFEYYYSALNFRKVIYSDYKITRKQKEPLYRMRLMQISKHLHSNWGMHTISGCEVDDILSVLHCIFNKRKINNVLCHNDKDYNQLIGLKYDMLSSKEYTISEKEALINLSKQLAMGDRIDNIVGLHRVGVVKATKLSKSDNPFGNILQEYINQFGLVEGIKKYNLNFNLLRLLTDDDVILEDEVIEKLKRRFTNKLEFEGEHGSTLYIKYSPYDKDKKTFKCN